MNKNPNQLNNKPFQSQLIPHFQTIKEMRQRRNSWVQIVEYLKTVGIITSPPPVYQFMKRHVRRPNPFLYTDNGEPENNAFIQPARRPSVAAKATWMEDGKVKPKKLNVGFDDGTEKYQTQK